MNYNLIAQKKKGGALLKGISGGERKRTAVGKRGIEKMTLKNHCSQILFSFSAYISHQV
jgi:hypothetical protein